MQATKPELCRPYGTRIEIPELPSTSCWAKLSRPASRDGGGVVQRCELEHFEQLDDGRVAGVGIAGRSEEQQAAARVAVPTGLEFRLRLYPTLARWASFVPPFGLDVALSAASAIQVWG